MKANILGSIFHLRKKEEENRYYIYELGKSTKLDFWNFAPGEFIFQLLIVLLD